MDLVFHPDNLSKKRPYRYDPYVTLFQVQLGAPSTLHIIGTRTIRLFPHSQFRDRPQCYLNQFSNGFDVFR